MGAGNGHPFPHKLNRRIRASNRSGRRTAKLPSTRGFRAGGAAGAVAGQPAWGEAIGGSDHLKNANGLNPNITDHVAEWRKGVKIAPVSKVEGRHTMHTYYLLNPESPDGRRVVFFASTDPAGHVGQICIHDRQTGAEIVLADEVHTEDAHRVALQQWTANG